jgi:hypothetical protein
VKLSVYNHLNDIGKEVKSHLNEIEIKNNTIFLIGRMERKRAYTVDVNPVLFNFYSKAI